MKLRESLSLVIINTTPIVITLQDRIKIKEIYSDIIPIFTYLKTEIRNKYTNYYL